MGETPSEYLRSLARFGVRPGLERTRALLDRLDSPERSFRSIHVAGTNGKSSTAAAVAAILCEHGVRAGAYLSPDVRGFHERIEIDGEATTPDMLDRRLEPVRNAAAAVEAEIERLGPVTQFEALTAAAFVEFGASGVEFAAVEAGLGGRLDATNVLDSTAQILTNVELDHTHCLGGTVAAIARDKLGIVPDDGTVHCGALSRDALDAVEVEASRRGLTVVAAGREYSWSIDTSGCEVKTAARTYRFRLTGEVVGGPVRLENFAVALVACEGVLGTLDPTAVKRAAAWRGLPGRFEMVDGDNPVLLDGAHNPAAAEALRANLTELEWEPIVGCLAIGADKDARAMLACLSRSFDHIVFTSFESADATPPATLARLCGEFNGPSCEVAATAPDALAWSVGRAGPGGGVVVAGSFHLLGELARLNRFGSGPHSTRRSTSSNVINSQTINRPVA